MSTPSGSIRTWRAPLAIGLASALGLLSALLADGIGDVISWAALATPVTVAAWYAMLKR